jgi:hypothetical protein
VEIRQKLGMPVLELRLLDRACPPRQADQRCDCQYPGASCNHIAQDFAPHDLSNS